MRKNFYAVKVGNGVEDVIFDNWQECKKAVWKYNSIYKGFSTVKEAKSWLKSFNDQKIKERLERQERMRMRRIGIRIE